MGQYDTDAGSLIRAGARGVGLRNVGSYQVSGMPWVTGSNNLDHGKVHMVEFPYVTKKIVVMNTTPGVKDTSREILVHFQSGTTAPITIPGETGEKASAGSNSGVISGFHYVPILLSGSFEFNVRCTKLYISNLNGVANSGYHVFAELTNILPQSMPHLTGSGITEWTP